VDSYVTTEASNVLDNYLYGTAQQLVAMTSPSQIFIRTKHLENGIYSYTFEDDAKNERRYSAWSRWTWNTAGGSLMSIFSNNGSLFTLSLRVNPDDDYPGALVLDEFSRESSLSDFPYLDSQRAVASGGSIDGMGTLIPTGPHVNECSIAIRRRYRGILADTTYERGNVGSRAVNYADFIDTYPTELATGLIYVGLNYSAFVEPTMPYRRDFRDRPILDGRMTITKFNLSMTDSSALLATVRDENAEYDGSGEVADWVYRPVGEWVLGTQPVAASFELTVPVMKEIRECRVRFESQYWLPMSISAIEYSGQFFSRRK
jgi:hypothetical protein